MNSHTIRHDTMAWKAQVWISFFTAASLCATGLAFLPGRAVDSVFTWLERDGLGGAAIVVR